MTESRPILNLQELQSASKGHWINLRNTNDCLEKMAISFVCTDSRQNCTGALFIALTGENFDGHDYLQNAVTQGSTALCISQDKLEAVKAKIGSVPALVVDDTLKAYQDIARYYRNKLTGVRIIGITGSSGKTSTKDILNTILVSEFGADHVYATIGNTNNHIGVPQNILSIRENHRYAIIEMGTNHYGEIDTIASISQPEIAVISSIGPAHLEFLKDLDGVAYEKSCIFRHFPSDKDCLAIFPCEALKYEAIKEIIRDTKYRTFGDIDKSDLRYEYLSSEIDGSIFTLTTKENGKTEEIRWPLTGEHQASNASAAALAAYNLGIPLERIALHLKQSSITGMRMKVTTENGITWINDAYNANPASTKAGIKWLSEITSGKAGRTSSGSRFVAILGDMLELGEKTEQCHQDVIRYAQKTIPNCRIFLVGPRMEQAVKAIKSEITVFNSTPDAIVYFKTFLSANDTVYLKGSRGMKLESIKNAITGNN